MASLGCISAEGHPKCPSLGKCCNELSAMVCMGEAIASYPEVKTEILLAAVTVLSKSSKTMLDIRKFIPRMEMAIQVAA
jgi:hypothetical protein